MINYRMRKKIHTILSFILLFYFFYSPQVIAVESKRVLFISSYHPSFPTFSQQVEGLGKTFSDKGVFFDVEFMDTKRFPQNSNWNSFRSELTRKMQGLPEYDLFIFGDDNALKFALEEQDNLFNDKPLVFFGVNNVKLAKEQDQNPQITGVVEAVSMEDTLLLMVRIQAEASNIIAIVDGTPSGQNDLKTFYQKSNKFDSIKFSEISLDSLSWEDFGEALGNIDKKEAVILLSAYQDKNGRQFHLTKALMLLRKIYHLQYFIYGTMALVMASLVGKLSAISNRQKQLQI
jgi:two-component system cell cycle sensor histidine kinase/response regulator CckA